MLEWINQAFEKIKDSLVNHGIDWIITSVITFISVRLATIKYYNSVSVSNVRPIMAQGLKKILGTDIIPANTKSILVENKGFTLFRGKKYKGEKCFSRLRKTICTVGGNVNSTSDARALYWGVLGLAYKKQSIVVFDFRQPKLLIYGVDLTEYPVTALNVNGSVKYYYQDSDNKHYLSDKQSGRNMMIAIPLMQDKNKDNKKKKTKILGGVTFDVDCKISSDPDDENIFLLSEKEKVIDICQTLNDLGSNIVNAYFAKR
ncbi:hypothetical protein JNO48_10560 [Clostridiales bacterium]|nr:hypothetical protein JNO48_10560 [Clostridiales bacterium]